MIVHSLNTQLHATQHRYVDIRNVELCKPDQQILIMTSL